MIHNRNTYFIIPKLQYYYNNHRNVAILILHLDCVSLPEKNDFSITVVVVVVIVRCIIFSAVRYFYQSNINCIDSYILSNESHCYCFYNITDVDTMGH